MSTIQTTVPAPSLALADDSEIIQAIVLAAAINGDSKIRGQLPLLMSAFEEPYRTVATTVNHESSEGRFIDRHTIAIALESCHLSRRTSQGAVEQLSAQQAVNLVFASDVQPGQAEAYVALLQSRQQAKQKAETKEKAVELAASLGDRPELLFEEVERLVQKARQAGLGGDEEFAPELLEIIPYMQSLVDQQMGSQFLGLDSGFQHLNNLANGLDTGLSVTAAPPGAGKTTLLWQIACQTAKINQAPVVFVSMEQSKQELRAKAIARLSKLQYRHILRGRLRADDQQSMQKVLDAATEYAQLARYLTIIEGDDTTTIDKISRVAATKMAQTGASRCLIVVDYLQVLPLGAASDLRNTSTKDRTDHNISALRRMARKLDSPVLAISSENRAGYGKSKTLDVFKESGGIEYSADIAMVLAPDKQANADPNSEFRAMDLNIIKNRNGERGVVKLKFYAKRAEFVETGREALGEESEN